MRVVGALIIKFDKFEVKFCKFNNKNNKFKSVLNEFDNVNKKEDKNKDIGILRKLVIAICAQRNVEGSIIVGIVVVIVPQL